MTGRKDGLEYDKDFMQLLERAGCSKEAIANDLGVSLDMVKQWSTPITKAKFSKCPRIRIEQLKIMLGIKLADLNKSQRARVLEILSYCGRYETKR